MSDNGDTPKRTAILDRAAKRFKLTTMQRKFADALASDPERNQTAAARVAGARFPEKEGSKWVRASKVKGYLQEIASLGRVTPPELDHAEVALIDMPKVERYLASHVFGSMADFVDIEVENPGTEHESNFPVFNFLKAKDRGCLHLIKKLKIKAGFKQAVDGGEPLPWTETDLELYDSDKSLDTWLKVHGLYKDGPGAQTGAMDALWSAFLARVPPTVLAALEAARLGGEVIDIPRLVEVTPGKGGGNGDG